MMMNNHTYDPSLTPIKRICVYCGSRSGKLANYTQVTAELARLLVAENIELVYGGADVGLMGTLADHVLNLGGTVIGIMPRFLAKKEIQHNHLTQLHLVDTMHQRKALMEKLSDAFIALPGGSGTLEEIAEIWTWAQIGLHHKPCGLLNIDGYYDHFKQFVQHAYQQGFMDEQRLNLLKIEQDPKTLLQSFTHFKSPTLPPKWDMEVVKVQSDL